MHRITLTIFTILSLLFNSLIVSAQQRTLTGKVVDSATGETLPGVTVQVKNTSIRQETDVNGAFSIKTDNENVFLVFSYVGYTTQEVAASGNAPLVVKLENALSNLDEVVVIGFGSVKKRDLTGSVASVKAQDIVRTPASNAMEAIQGQVPGVDIVRQSGAANAGTSINIRGNRSLSTAKDENGNPIANSPLFIVDGVMGANISDIPPQDIESIDVMKDASSTAIYGSQGANGVIIVTTKKGKEGRTNISYNGFAGVNGWAQYPEMRTGDDYINLRREAGRTAGQWNSAADDQTLFTPEEWSAIQNNQWVNWKDQVMHNSLVQSHQLTASGGNAKTTALLSAGYYQEKGTFKNDLMNKYTARINVDHKLSNIFSVGINSQITHYASSTRSPNVLWRAATNVPLGLPYDEDGKVVLWPLGLSGMVSPLADEASNDVAQHQTLTTNIIANGYLEFKPIEGLSFRSQLGTNLSYNKLNNFEGVNSIDRAGNYNVSLASIQSNDKSFIDWDNIITYTKDINDHSFGITALTSFTRSKFRGLYAEGTGQLIPNQLWNNLSANDKSSYNINSNYIQYQTFSYAFRANYSYKGRYLLTVTNRWDGASRLSKDHKWAAFPSAAFAWRVNDESWFKDKFSGVDNLKVRLSWGLTGNSGIDPYGTQTGLLAYSNSAFQDQGYTYYVYKTLLGNENLGWEKSSTWNLGFDIGILKSRLNATIDLYDTKTTDLLLPRTLPTSMGSGNNTPFQIYQNIGATNNKGIELTINSANVMKDDFEWHTTATFYANKEKITKLIDGRDIIGSPVETGTLLLGRPVHSFYTYKREGIWQTSEADEAATYYKDAAKTQPFQPGDIKVADLNGDHVIDAVNDVTYIGSTNPKWSAGLNNTFRYKNFDMSFYIIARWGQYIQDDLTASYDPSGKGNQPAYLDYWTPENPSNDFPRPNLTNFYNYVGYQSLNFIDGSYLKLRTVSLGYNFPKEWANKMHMQGLRIYVSGNNLYTIAKSDLLKNYDPERGGAATSPLLRQFVFGVNLSL